jgi:nitrate reductase NapAB chaperone NapD
MGLREKLGKLFRRKTPIEMAEEQAGENLILSITTDRESLSGEEIQKIRNLAKKYGASIVNDDFTLNLKTGEGKEIQEKSIVLVLKLKDSNMLKEELKNLNIRFSEKVSSKQDKNEKRKTKS